MEKLEIKLTLTPDSTPELLRYLRGISSARDRAFILKRLATVGLATVNGGAAGIDAVLLAPQPSPSAPAADPLTPPRQPELAPLATAPFPAAPSVAVPFAPPANTAAPAVAQVPPSTDQELTPAPAVEVGAGFEFLDLEALNAATAQFS